MEEVKQALVWLHNNGYLDDNKFNFLNKYYENDKRDIEVIKEEVRGFYQNAKSIVDKKSTDDIEIIDIDEQTIDKENYLSSVSDMINDGKKYIKLNYQDGSVKIFLNNLDFPGEVLFNRLVEKYGNNNYDVTVLFESMIKNSVEVSFYNFDDLTNKQVYDQLSDLEKQDYYIVKSTYPGKQVIDGVNNNIYIIREELKDDLYVTVSKKNGVYQVLPIFNVSNNDYALNDENNSRTKSGIQKTLGSNPATGKSFKFWDEDAGFMNILFFIFFSGIGVGIVFMTILNFFA